MCSPTALVAPLLQRVHVRPKHRWPLCFAVLVLILLIIFLSVYFAIYYPLMSLKWHRYETCQINTTLNAISLGSVQQCKPGGCQCGSIPDNSAVAYVSIIGTRLNGLACCSSAAASNSFVKLSGCGAMPSGYPYEMSSGAPALWMCQNRVDCKTFFKANQIFFGCSYTSTSHGNYVLVDGMRRARIPTGDYIGGLWVGCFGLMVIFAFCVGKCEWRAWAGDHPRHWLVTWACCAPLRCKCCDRCKCRECKQPDAVEPGDAAAPPGDAEAPSPGTHAANASHSGQVPGGKPTTLEMIELSGHATAITVADPASKPHPQTAHGASSIGVDTAARAHAQSVVAAQAGHKPPAPHVDNHEALYRQLLDGLLKAESTAVLLQALDALLRQAKTEPRRFPRGIRAHTMEVALESRTTADNIWTPHARDVLRHVLDEMPVLSSGPVVV